MDSNEHVFESEELRDNPVPDFKDHYGCRYVHSIYSPELKNFRHFDGAIRMYSEDMMIDRLDKNFDKSGKQAGYTKLFRIDGELPLECWKSLVTNYYQGNPLIHEYFGEGYRGVYASEENNTSSIDPIQQLVPFSFGEKKGVRILLSYHRKDIFPNKKRVVTSWDNLQFAEEKFKVIEYEFVEVIKLLNKSGEVIELPNEFEWILTKDMYWNIPNIHHGADDLDNNFCLTIEALSQVMAKLLERQMEKVISISLSFPMNDRVVRVAIAGTLAELYEWIKENTPIPTKHEALKIWLEDQREWLENSFEPSLDSPSLFNLVQTDGMFFFKRQAVLFDYNLLPSKEGLRYEMKIPEKDFTIGGLVADGKLSAVISLLSPKGKCSKTNVDYLESGYSKLFDDDVHQIIDSGKCLGLFWTDLPV